MKTWETTNDYKIVQVLSGRCNAYLVSHKGYNILIDTGKESKYNQLQKNIKNITKNKGIDFLILTHTHFDHCQNAFELQQTEKCKVIVSGKENTSTQSGYTQLPKGTNPITSLISALGKQIEKKKFGYKPFTPDFLVHGFMFLTDFELDIKIIETPGHSIGSLSIIIDNEIAIVGDTLFGVFKPNILPPYADDVQKLIESWRKLLNTTCRLFLPGHGGEIKRETLHMAYNARI